MVNTIATRRRLLRVGPCVRLHIGLCTDLPIIMITVAKPNIAIMGYCFPMQKKIDPLIAKIGIKYHARIRLARIIILLAA